MLDNNCKSLELHGFYRGMVLKHLSHGICKIYIPGVYDNSLSSINNWEMLPDAEPAVPIFGGNNFYNGVFSYPNISSIVWCFFQNNDANYPVYFAATQGGLCAYTEYDNIKHCSDISSQRSYDLLIHGQEDKSNRHVINVENNNAKSYILFDEDGNIDTHLINKTEEVSSQINILLSEEKHANIYTYITSKYDDSESFYKDDNLVISETASRNIEQKTLESTNTIDLVTDINSAISLSEQKRNNNSNTINSEVNDSGSVYEINQKSKSSSNVINISSKGSNAIIDILNSGSNKCHIVVNSNGTITIDTGKSVTINTTDVTVNSKSSYTVNTPSYTVNAPSIKLNGNTTNSGTMNIGAVTTFSNGFTFEGHIHMGDGGPVPAPTSNPIG